MVKRFQKECKGGEKASRKCPSCHSNRNWRDGKRKTKNGSVQRFICRDCGVRFSESSVLSRNLNNSGGRQVCAILTEAKNLTKVEPFKNGLAGATTDIKGKIVEFIWFMKKQGYSEATIRTYSAKIRKLVNLGVDLFDPESVKEILAKHDLSSSYKNVIIATYTLFLKTQGMKWDPPMCKVTRKLPFIPTERELDDLIAGCGKKTTAFLQLLKETAMRKGEASSLKLEAVDLQRRILTLNNPAKRGTSRIFNLSSKLVNMLASLPKRNEYLFGTSNKRSRASVFYKERKRLAYKLGNPRLLKIGLHTFRHWKATTLYHQTRDPVLVKEFLGHRTLDTTLLYIQLEKALFKAHDDEFIVKATKDTKKIEALLKVGFEYVCQKGGLIFFRKRK
jgi:integrase